MNLGCTENERIDEDINLFYNALVRDDKFISERLHLLANTMYEAGCGRDIRE